MTLTDDRHGSLLFDVIVITPCRSLIQAEVLFAFGLRFRFRIILRNFTGAAELSFATTLCWTVSLAGRRTALCLVTPTAEMKLHCVQLVGRQWALCLTSL